MRLKIFCLAILLSSVAGAAANVPFKVVCAANENALNALIQKETFVTGVSQPMVGTLNYPSEFENGYTFTKSIEKMCVTVTYAQIK